MPSHIEKTSVNSLADAFRQSDSVIRLGLQARAVLRRKNLRPRTVQKWHRLAATALVVAKSF